MSMVSGADVRARLEALMRMLEQSGDMTPMAVRQLQAVLDDEGIA